MSGYIICLHYEKLLIGILQVLQIIPESMFGVLHQIITILTNDMKEVRLPVMTLLVDVTDLQVPTRLDKDKMKEFSQLEERYKVCRHCSYMWHCSNIYLGC